MQDASAMLNSARAQSVALLVLGLLLLLLPSLFPAYAQDVEATVEVERFRLTCPSSAVEGDTLQCTIADTGAGAAAWPVVGILHLSSDADRALVRGVPVDVALQAQDGGTEVDGGVWWIGDVLVGYARVDLAGESDGDGDSRTISIMVHNDGDYEAGERFYVALAENGRRSVGALYLNRLAIEIGASDTRSTDASLTDLDVSTGDGRLPLAFFGTTTSYAVSVAYEVAEAVVTPTASHGRATIAVQGVPVESGAGSAAVALGVGETRVETVVTAEDGSSRTYVIGVTRAARGENVEVAADGFTLTCPALVDEGTDVSCVLANGTGAAADWPVVAILHSSVDADGALVAETPLIPASSPAFATDAGLATVQTPARSGYNVGYGELFSGESRSIYTTYGYQKFDWPDAAAAAEERSVVVSVVADDAVEEEETFYVALAPSGYTGLSQLADNKAPVVVQDARAEAPGAPTAVAVAPGDGELTVSWVPPLEDGGKPVTGYVVQWKADGEDYDATREALAESSPHTVDGLQNGTAYTARVVAVNAAGRGEPSGEAAGTPAPPIASSDATLNALTLTGVDIGVFDATKARYAGRVVNAVSQTTVTATPSDGSATVAITAGGAETAGRQHVVALDEGGNAIAVVVTATDGVTTLRYEVAVTREGQVTITASAASVSEGTAAVFELARTGLTDEALTVAIDVTQSGSVLAGNPGASVAIGAGETTATLSLATEDDRVVEADGAVTVEVGAGTGYAVGTPGSATVVVEDGDAPSWHVSLDTLDLAEGSAATLTVSAGEVTFEAEQSLAVRTVGGSAERDRDYTVPATITVAAGAGSADVTVEVADDAEEEDAEDARLAVLHGDEEVGTASFTIAANDERTDDATLAMLALSGIAFEFQSGVEDYAVDAGQLERTTVTLSPSDADASVAIDPGDADGDGANGHQVGLSVGENVVAVTVTSENEQVTKTYTVKVTRTELDAALSLRQADRDFDGLDENVPFGLWSDDTTLWVATWWGGGLVAFDLAGGSRTDGRDIGTASDNGSPIGLWADGQTLWVAEYGGGIYAYRLSDGERVSAQDVGATMTAVGNEAPTGLWSDGSTLWVADRFDAHVYAYRLSDKTRDGDREFSLDEGTRPYGLWSDGTTMWVTDFTGGRVAAYTLADGVRDESRDYDTSLVGNASPTGVWSDGATLWVGDRYDDDKLYAYALFGAAEGDASGDATLRGLSLSGIDIGEFDSATTSYTADVGNGVSSTTVTATANDAGASVTIADADGSTTDAARTVTLDIGENAIMVTVTAADGETTGTYTVSVTRAASSDATLSALSLSGIDIGTFDGGTTAYAASVGNDVSSTTVTATANDAGARVTIADADGSTTDAARTVSLNVGPNTITVTVSAADGDTSTAYTITVTRAPPPPSDDATLSGLTLTGIDIGAFDGATTAYTGSVGHDVTSTTVTATANDAGASVTIADADGSTADARRTVSLSVGGNTITATVTAADETTTATYTVSVTRAASSDATLSGLTLSGVDIGTFDGATTAYAGSVGHDVTSTTVTATANDAGARATIADADGRTTDAPRTVTLGVGGNAITVTVTAADGETTGTYTVSVTRAASSDATLSGLTLSGIDIGTFDGGTTAYATSVGHDATSTTVTATANDAGASVTIADADGSTTNASRTVSLSVGENAITVTVSAADDETTATYTVTVTRAASSDATLSGLTLSGVDIGTFDGATTAYAGSVDHDVTSTTVTATANDAGASATIADADGSTTDAPRTVTLGVGENAITVTVSAADGETTATYSVAVTRARGPLTAEFEDVPAEHYGSLEFELGLRFSEEFPLSYKTVRRAVKAEGGVVRNARRTEPGSNLRWRITVRPQTVREVTVRLPGGRPCDAANAICTADGRALSNSPTATLPGPDFEIAADAESVSEGTSAEFTVTRAGAAELKMEASLLVTESGNVLRGPTPHSVIFERGENSVALMLATDDDAVSEADSTVTATLDIRPTRVSASVTVRDDDEATFAISAEPAEIEEGATSTVTVSIDNGVTFAKEQTLSLSAAGTATAADYTLEPTTLTLAAGAGAVEAALAATDDAAKEDAETVVVSATLGGSNVGEATVTITANDASASDDATLAALVLSGIDLGPFDPETTDYAAEVEHGVDEATVTATPNDAAADVVISDAEGSTAGTTRTTRLAQGANAVGVEVTAEDGIATRNYGVTVTRAVAASAAWGERLAERDIDLSAADRPRGLWSDGETLWTADWDNGTVLAYALADGSRAESKDFTLGEYLASALWSDGETLWVADYDGGVYAYGLSDGERLADDDLDGDTMAGAGNDAPAGLWSDGDTLWVADHGDGFVYAYRLADGERREEKEFTLRTDDDKVVHIRPFGLFSDGETVLATDWLRGTVRGYWLGGGARHADRDIGEAATANRYAAGLWSDGETLWVVDELEQKAVAYAGAELRDPPESTGSLIGELRSRAAVVPGDAAAGAPVSILDAGLRGRIAAALGKSRGDTFGARELAALQVLDARNAGVASLAGLEHAVNLEGIDLGRNEIADLRPLSSLSALRRLNLDGATTDLWPLAGLTALTGLSLRGAGMEDVEALSGLKQLAVLDLAENRISDLAPIARLSRLRALRLDGNHVADLSPLAAMEMLRHLWLSGNEVTELNPLSRLLRLQTLDLRDNRVGDLSPLAGLRALRLLDVRGNAILDFWPVEGRTELRVIHEGGDRRDAR